MGNRPLTELEKKWYERELKESEDKLKDLEGYIQTCKDRLEHGMWVNEVNNDRPCSSLSLQVWI